MQNFRAIRPAVRKPFQENSWGGRIAPPPARARVNIHGFAIQACLDTLFSVCTKTIVLNCFNFCVNLNLCSQFTEKLALNIKMDILDMMLKWMDMDGLHNLANGYGWIWISSIFFAWIWMDMDLLNFFVDGYGWIWILQNSSMSIST